MKKSFATLFAVAICVALISSNSDADDRKVFPGANCVEMWDTAPEIYYMTGGHAQNSSTGSNTWVCPVVRDIMASSMDISDWDITVHRHANSTAAWNITLWSTDVQGWNGYGNTVTVPAGEGYHSVDGGRINSAHTNGQLFIETTIPREARICSYNVAEEP
jgi:hypothetical protein